LRYAAVVLVVALVVPLAGGIEAEAKTSAVPAKLVGQWTRKVSSADVKREHAVDVATGDVSGTVWTLAIKKSGGASLAGIRYWTGRLRLAGKNRVHIDVGLPYPSIYKWQVSGRQLTLRKVVDFPLRAAVLQGVWKRT
jgi:hypothetical protein